MLKLKTNWQVVIGGEGGQGLLVAGILLGEAAVREGKQATQTAAYGIASRGGFSKAEVVISDEEIDYPAVEYPDVVLALSQEAMDKYYGKVPDDCLIIYDSSLINGSYDHGKVLPLPLTEKIKELKKVKGLNLALNIVGLGTIIGATNLVSMESVEGAIKEQWQKNFEQNREALQVGSELSRARAVNRQG